MSEQDETIDVVESVEVAVDEAGNVLEEDIVVAVDEATGEGLMDDVVSIETPEGDRRH